LQEERSLIVLLKRHTQPREMLAWRTMRGGRRLTALCVAHRMFSDIRQFHELFNLAGPDFTAQVAGTLRVPRPGVEPSRAPDLLLD